MQAKPRVLVVEDQAEILNLIRHRDDFRIELARDGVDARERIRAEHFDVYILDWDLEGAGTLDLIRMIRQQVVSLAPILVLTANATTEEHTTALNSGADDFLSKPFQTEVLISKLRALLRRSHYPTDQNPLFIIEADRLRIDLAAHEAQIDGKTIALTASEFKILATLARHRRRALSREQLIDIIRGSEVAIVERAIDTHVSSLRKKLGPCAFLIETIRSVGYRMK